MCQCEIIFMVESAAVAEMQCAALLKLKTLFYIILL